MISIQPGHTALFYHQGILRPGLVLAVEEHSCLLLDVSGCEHKLAAGRLALSSEESLVPPDLESLRTFAGMVEDAATGLDLSLIQNSLAWLPAPFSFDAACGALGFQHDVRRFALFLRLRLDEENFALRKGLFRLRGEEERAAFRAADEHRRERLGYLDRIADWLAERQQGRMASLPDHLRARLIDELCSLQLAGVPKDLAGLLHAKSGTADTAEYIQSLRLFLQDISTQTDPVAARSGLPISFPPELWRQTLPLPELPLGADGAFSIDASDTPDHDDAISLCSTAEGWLLGIHISDVASRLPLQSGLFAAARERVASLYLPGETIPLLPEPLSKNEFSLVRGAARPVLSLYVRFDRAFGLLAHEFRRETLRLERNLAYNEADSLITQEPFSTLSALASSLRAGRGGLEREGRPRYEWEVKARGEDIQLLRTDLQSPSRFIVEELMILYNRLLAADSQPRGLPLVYRNISEFEPEEDDAEETAPGIQAYLSTEAKFHPGIGSNAYLHATSPIRRFTDILNQAQFSALLANLPPPFSRGQLEALIPPITRRLALLRDVARRSERHWFLLYLRQKRLNEPLDAVFVRKLHHGYLAELLPWGKRIALLCEERPPLRTNVKLVLSSIDLAEQRARGDVIL